MSGDANGRIRLSWAQIAWAIATMAAIMGSWADTRSQLALTRQELALRANADDKEHDSLRQEDQRIWGAVREVQASERSRPRR